MISSFSRLRWMVSMISHSCLVERERRETSVVMMVSPAAAMGMLQLLYFTKSIDAGAVRG